jgi:hypothetical protein
LSEFKTKQNTIFFNSDKDSAKVFIQDSLVGYTPLELFDYPSGTYNVKFVYDTLEVNRRGVDYQNGDYREVTGVFKKGFAMLSIYSNPTNAKVFFNDSLVGFTPFNNKYVKTGVYNVSLIKEGYSTWKWRINLHSDLYHYDVKLQNLYGEISILRNNPNENFLIDNTIPQYINPMKIKIGEHKIKVSSVKYHKDYEETVEIMSDRNYRVKFNYNVKSYTPLFMSTLIPGLGQYYDNSKLKGTMIFAGNILLGYFAVRFADEYNQDLKNYKNKIEIYRAEKNEFNIITQKKEMDDAYKSANNSLKTRNFTMGAFVLTYLFNLVDAYLNHSITGEFMITSNISSNNISAISLRIPIK